MFHKYHVFRLKRENTILYNTVFIDLKEGKEK